MSGSDWIGGIHAVAALLDKDPAALLELMIAREARNPRLDELAAQARAAGIAVQRAPRATLDRLAAGLRHQDVLANARVRAAADERDLPALVSAAGAQALLLVLDGVTDPHNLGACLRNADAFGAHAVVVPKDHSAPLNATARKAASGAADLVPLVSVTNLARTLRALQEAGIWIVGAAGESAQELRRVDLSGPIALVLGAEGSGMRRLTREHCDHLAAIPMAGTVSSLNVSVAAGVFLYEASRQRSAP